MKKIKLTLGKDEKGIVNNVLLENCMRMTDVLRGQTSKEGHEQVMQILQVTVSIQQNFFSACLEDEVEMPEQMVHFIKPILEGSLENLKGVKENLIKSGDPNGFAAANFYEILNNIVNKFPNPSVIIAP
jgi:hypothetical protein